MKKTGQSNQVRKPLKVSEAIGYGQSRMEAADKGENAVDVEWLLCDILGMNRTMLQLEHGRTLSEEEEKRFLECLHRRLSGEPLQYILKHQSFYGYDFYVDERVLIPRFETEELVEKAVKALKGMSLPKVMDLCSGSGCIGISVMKECDSATCTFVDVSPDALEVAKRNSITLGVGNRSRFLESDLFTDVDDSAFDMILSNPPYIRSEVIGTLTEEVAMKEPALALDGGQDGLDFYRKIAAQSKDKMKTGGYLMMEIGHDQMAAVIGILEECGYLDIEGYKDFSGNDRMIVCRKM